MLGVNTYLIINEKNKECFVIDPGDEFNKIKQKIVENGANCKAVLLTHGHFDHIGAVKDFQDEGVAIYVKKEDEQFCIEPRSERYAHLTKGIKSFSADHYVEDKQVLKIADIDVEVIHTPGHSKGSVTYKIENNLFCGDTLFFQSIGRTDFPSGSYDEIISSIKNKLFCYSNMRVYPGHGVSTSIDEEKLFNPYFNGENK